jgi:hypothetical protein
MNIEGDRRYRKSSRYLFERAGRLDDQLSRRNRLRSTLGTKLAGGADCAFLGVCHLD